MRAISKKGFTTHSELNSRFISEDIAYQTAVEFRFTSKVARCCHRLSENAGTFAPVKLAAFA